MKLTREFVENRNCIRVTGRGSRPLVFAHGFGCDQNMWRFLTPRFEAEYQVVTFDFVGAGRSDFAAYDPLRYDSLEGYAQDIVEICEALQLRDVLLVGHSAGATIAMLAAQSLPKTVSGLVLLSATPCFINDLPHYTGGFESRDLEALIGLIEKNDAGWPDYLAPLVIGKGNSELLVRELTSSFRSISPDIAKRFGAATFLSDYRWLLPQVDVPTLILESRRDSLVPRAVGQYMRSHIRRSVLREVDKAGHCLHMTAPGPISREMRAFVVTHA